AAFPTEMMACAAFESGPEMSSELSPAGAVAGTLKLIWYRPASVGASPVYETSAEGTDMPPTATPMVFTVRLKGLVGPPAPSGTVGNTLPRPVTKATMTSPGSAGSAGVTTDP